MSLAWLYLDIPLHFKEIKVSSRLVAGIPLPLSMASSSKAYGRSSNWMKGASPNRPPYFVVNPSFNMGSISVLARSYDGLNSSATLLKIGGG